MSKTTTTLAKQAASAKKRLAAARARLEARAAKAQALRKARAAKAITEERYLKILNGLGLSVIGAADVFGFSPRQSQRYAAGDVIPEPTAKLLRLAEQGKLTAEQIMEL